MFFLSFASSSLDYVFDIVILNSKFIYYHGNAVLLLSSVRVNLLILGCAKVYFLALFIKCRLKIYLLVQRSKSLLTIS